MNCKLCNSPNSEISYKLRYANVIVCKKCEFHYINYLDPEPTNDPLQTGNTPSDELSDYLANQLQFNKDRFSNHVKITQTFMPEGQDLNILDIGCGGGLYLSLIQSNRIHCYGIEPDLGRLHYARMQTGIQEIYPNPIESDFWQANFKEYFDIITLWDVIEHVNYPLQIFQNAFSLLKPGGKLILDTPNRNGFFHVIGKWTYKLSLGYFPGFLNLMYNQKPYGHKQIFSLNDFKRICQITQLSIISAKSFHELSFPVNFYLEKKGYTKYLNWIVHLMLKWNLLKIIIKNKQLLIFSKPN